MAAKWQRIGSKTALQFDSHSLQFDNAPSPPWRFRKGFFMPRCHPLPIFPLPLSPLPRIACDLPHRRSRSLPAREVKVLVADSIAKLATAFAQ